jgi:uncharacterized protein (DUF58 family)
VSQGAVGLSDLFDAEFLASVRHLRIVASRVPRGGRHAEQRSLDMGAGIEFRDFRPYSPGDDFRSIDWNIYRRLGRVFVRLFEEFEDLPVYLLADGSESMYHEDPPRARAGLRTALGLASIALHQHDRVGFYTMADDLEVVIPPRSGRGRLLSFAEAMAAVTPGRATDLARSLGRFEAMRLRPGLLVVISDFFDPAGTGPVLQALRRSRHRLLLVRLERTTDRDPDLRGDLQLVDCESGEAETVTVTSAVLARYRQAWDAFEREIADFARRRGAGLLRLDVDQPVVPQLADLFVNASYRA